MCCCRRRKRRPRRSGEQANDSDYKRKLMTKARRKYHFIHSYAHPEMNTFSGRFSLIFLLSSFAGFCKFLFFHLASKAPQCQIYENYFREDNPYDMAEEINQKKH